MVDNLTAGSGSIARTQPAGNVPGYRGAYGGSTRCSRLFVVLPADVGGRVRARVMDGWPFGCFVVFPGLLYCVELPRKLPVWSEIVGDGANKLIALWRRGAESP